MIIIIAVLIIGELEKIIIKILLVKQSTIKLTLQKKSKERIDKQVAQCIMSKKIQLPLITLIITIFIISIQYK